MAERSLIAVLLLFTRGGGTLVYEHRVGIEPEAPADKFR